MAKTTTMNIRCTEAEKEQAKKQAPDGNISRYVLALIAADKK